MRRVYAGVLKEDRPKGPTPPALANSPASGRIGQMVEAALIRPPERDSGQIELAPTQCLGEPRAVFITHALRDLADRSGTEKEEAHGFKG